MLDGLRIGIARDSAFAFLYRANLDLLRSLGSKLIFFSPLADQALPDADALYLPGGYPELHLDRLAANRPIQAAIRAHHASGRPMLAECGGMLYVLEPPTDVQGAQRRDGRPAAGARDHACQLGGAQRLASRGGDTRAHLPLLAPGHEDGARCLEPRQEACQRGKPIYRDGGLHASYMHLYFPSNPEVVARLFNPENRGRS